MEPADLDYNYYLPIFFEGLRDKQDPYWFISILGTYDMIDKAKDSK